MPATDFLVRVADADEVRVALDAGADRLGLTDARGAVSRDAVRAIVAAAGRCPVSAPPTALGKDGDPSEAAKILADAGVATVEFRAGREAAGQFATLRTRYPVVTIAVTFRTLDEPLSLGSYAERGVQAAILRPASLNGSRLIETPGIEALAAFVEGAQRRGLQAWLGGALEPPDVPRMLALRPDALAFRASLCRDGSRQQPLDPARVAMVRALIPRASSDADRREGAPAAPLSRPPASDKVFVRDFVVEAGIGAYQFEHRNPQRMRFNVEADLAPIVDTVADMRDVFSYDVIVDAIRLATRRHVLLVERIALDVAHATLRDDRVRRVRVRVEKLDIIDGAVGVEIERDAAA